MPKHPICKVALTVAAAMVIVGCDRELLIGTINHAGHGRSAIRAPSSDCRQSRASNPLTCTAARN
jgi:hypothetical protein